VFILPSRCRTLHVLWQCYWWRVVWRHRSKRVLQRGRCQVGLF